jgi:hypothetical protein
MGRDLSEVRCERLPDVCPLASRSQGPLLKHLLQAGGVLAGLAQVRFKRRFQFGTTGGLRHFWAARRPTGFRR